MRMAFLVVVTGGTFIVSDCTPMGADLAVWLVGKGQVCRVLFVDSVSDVEVVGSIRMMKLLLLLLEHQSVVFLVEERDRWVQHHQGQVVGLVILIQRRPLLFLRRRLASGLHGCPMAQRSLYVGHYRAFLSSSVVGNDWQVRGQLCASYLLFGGHGEEVSNSTTRWSHQIGFLVVNDAQGCEFS